jgi:nucleoside-diphosphate-sugar epimerase
MKLDSKIFVAGHNGMVGSAIVRRLFFSIGKTPKLLVIKTFSDTISLSPILE